ncbi:MAG: hypothetical protein M3067_10905 [Chloroflexota bacterium]|nr:hypothetical protein [Chloroflexota bacterium]
MPLALDSSGAQEHGDDPGKCGQGGKDGELAADRHEMGTLSTKIAPQADGTDARKGDDSGEDRTHDARHLPGGAVGCAGR